MLWLYENINMCLAAKKTQEQVDDPFTASLTNDGTADEEQNRIEQK